MNTMRRLTGRRLGVRGVRSVGPPASKLPAALEDMPKNRNPWKKIKDKETGLAYYWNQDTDETTSPGAARPRHWVQVRDKDTSGVYYWCPETDETTAIGEPRPSYDDDLARQQSYLNAGPPPDLRWLHEIHVFVGVWDVARLRCCEGDARWLNPTPRMGESLPVSHC